MRPRIPDVNNRSVNKPCAQVTKKKAVKIHNDLTGENRVYCTTEVRQTIQRAAFNAGWSGLSEVEDRFILEATICVKRKQDPANGESNLTGGDVIQFPLKGCHK